MTFREAQLSLLLAAEERLGFVTRERARLAMASEDAAYESVVEAVGGRR